MDNISFSLPNEHCMGWDFGSKVHQGIAVNNSIPYNWVF
jgi:hypothetical protein